MSFSKESAFDRLTEACQSGPTGTSACVDRIQAQLLHRLLQLSIQVGHYSDIPVLFQVSFQAPGQPRSLLSIPAAGNGDIIAGSGIGLL